MSESRDFAIEFHVRQSFPPIAGSAVHSFSPELNSSAGTHSESEANFVPKSTTFQVTVSSDRQHFRAVIGETCLRVEANDMGGGSMHCGPPRVLPLEDGPEGPLISLPG
jgi:hypothetical protein